MCNRSLGSSKRTLSPACGHQFLDTNGKVAVHDHYLTLGKNHPAHGEIYGLTDLSIQFQDSSGSELKYFADWQHGLPQPGGNGDWYILQEFQ